MHASQSLELRVCVHLVLLLLPRGERSRLQRRATLNRGALPSFALRLLFGTSCDCACDLCHTVPPQSGITAFQYLAGVGCGCDV